MLNLERLRNHLIHGQDQPKYYKMSMISVSENPIDAFFGYLNKFVDRIKLLIASQTTENAFHYNEIYRLLNY